MHKSQMTIRLNLNQYTAIPGHQYGQFNDQLLMPGTAECERENDERGQHEAERVAEQEYVETHTYKVYHNSNTMAMIWPDPQTWVTQRDSFKMVARVVTESLEKVFELTNHIEGNWTTNPEVEWPIVARNNLRSTSVGDVILHKATDQAWMVMPSGFTLIEQPKGL